MSDLEDKYEKAKKRVENIKGWYNHLTVYIVINTLLQMFYAGWFEGGAFTQHFPWWVRLTTPFFWGLSLLIHGVWVFKGPFAVNFYKRWEERKIKEFLDEEENEFKNKWQ